MTKRMLIDATHPEETRVAVINGNKLEEYDFETLVRRQLKSNIYLVKVTRVEPSLQAAFVDFGGNRHGFLPFPEIHPDYYRIPIADREALLAEERAIAAAQAAREDEEDRAELEAAGESIEDIENESPAGDEDEEDGDEGDYVSQHTGSLAADIGQSAIVDDSDDEDEDEEDTTEPAAEHVEVIEIPIADLAAKAVAEVDAEAAAAETLAEEGGDEQTPAEEEEEVDMVGGDVVEQPVYRSSIKRRYKIQEVIKRNQIMLIQISKEERGNKGAAVTSYISLPGRYCVLMPNSPRGGGVSRKVSNAKDRQRLKVILRELNVPEGMSVILRTAGVSRSKAEIKRDLDYLLRLWDQIRELTLRSTAPALIYEEGNLIKRAIRDLYRRDIDEVHVAGEDGFKSAHDFMRTLMPSHASRVHQYTDETMPLFFRYQVEKQIDEIHNPTVHLKSGGYIVINPTEALVSIDVNSGKATKGRHIEETALKTNLEAAEEIARQLRLRDQGGLIVIDFIDMEDKRANRIVEKRLRDAMQNDRARIQLGRISAFGLLELSRQRLHPSLVESNFQTCKHCNGSGLIRTAETAGVIVLRAIEEEGMKNRGSDIRASVPTEVALFIFNNKREMLTGIEKRYGIRVLIHADDALHSSDFNVSVARASGNEGRRVQRNAPVQSVDISDLPDIPEDEITDDSTVSEDEAREGRVYDADSDDDGEEGDNRRHGRGGRGGFDRDGRGRRRGRRGGRRRGGREGGADPRFHEGPQPDYSFPQVDAAVASAPAEGMPAVEGGEAGDQQPREGRNRHRGGRNRNRRGGRDRGDRGNRGGEGQPQREAGENNTASGMGEQAPAPRRDTSSDHHNDGGNGDSGQVAAEGGNRKGWWKRLTE